MNTKDWITILIPAGISILGFVITFLKMRKEFSDSIKKDMYLSKKELYLNDIMLFERLSENIVLVEDQEVQMKMRRISAEVDLFASENVRQCTCEFMTYVFELYDEIAQEIKKIDLGKISKGEFIHKKMNEERSKILQFQLKLVGEIKKDLKIK